MLTLTAKLVENRTVSNTVTNRRWSFIGYLVRVRLFLIVSLSAATVLLLYSSSEGSNLLDNGNFMRWKGGPEGWGLEGKGTAEDAGADGVKFTSFSAEGPFLFQQVEVKKGLRGREIMLAAWVRTDSPDSAVIEFSDREGTDVKSEAHPGDGRWRLLKLKVKPPGSAKLIEFRLRNYSTGVVFLKDAYMSTAPSGVMEGSGPVPALTGALRLFGVAAAIGASAVVVVYFRSKRNTFHARLFEAALLLFILSSVAQVYDRGPGSEVASNMAWTALSGGSIAYGLRGLKERGSAILLNPKALYLATVVVLVLVILNSIRTGSVYYAEKAATLLYALFVLAFLTIAAKRVRTCLITKTAAETVKVRIKRPEPSTEAVEEVFKEDRELELR